MTLGAKLGRLVWRFRAVRLARWLSACLLCALCLAIVTVAADRLFYLGVNLHICVLLLLALAVPGAALAATLREPVSRLRVAMETDRRLNLGDRVASALELGRSDGPWARAVIADAENFVRDVRAPSVFPFKATVCTRLLLPAGIGLVLASIMPHADLLGRMERDVQRRAAGAANAERTQNAIAAAAPELGALGGESQPDAKAPRDLAGLQMTIVQIQKDILKGMDPARRVELGEELRRLADRLAAENAAKELSESIRRSADALARADQKAIDALSEVQRQLAELVEALKAAQAGSDEIARRIDRRLSELRSEQASALPTPELKGVRPEGELLELEPVGKDPLAPASDRGGIIYSRRGTGADTADASLTYERAAKSAQILLESGGIPAEDQRLVRGYFDAIRPARD